MYVIKNSKTEQFAQDIARAIKEEDEIAYENLMQENEAMFDNMVRWELIAFKERVHYLVHNTP